MKSSIVPVFCVNLLMIATTSPAQSTNHSDHLREFKRHAAKFNAVVTVPQFELDTNEIRSAVHQTVAVGNSALDAVGAPPNGSRWCRAQIGGDRKSTRLNSSHQIISYAVFCL